MWTKVFVFIIFAAITSVNLAAQLGDGSSDCEKYPLGISHQEFDGSSYILATSREQPLSSSDESLSDAYVLAELRAKTLMSEYLKTNSLRGLIRVCGGERRGYVYVGVVSSSENTERARSIKEIIYESIRRFRTPGK